MELAVYDQVDELRSELDKYDIINDSDMRELISDKQQRLHRALKQSICMCPVCGSTSSDMIFNTHDKYWHCIKCYNENQEFHRKRGKGYLYP